MNIRTSISLPKEYVQALERGRGELNLSRSAFVRFLLDLHGKLATEVATESSGVPDDFDDYLRRIDVVVERYKREPERAELLNRVLREALGDKPE